MSNQRILPFVLLFCSLISGLMAQNDKQVLGDAVFTPDEIIQGGTATYLIRFQNTSLDTANNIVVRDTLDPRLDASTFQMIDASHQYQVLREQGYIRWYFSGIRLPSVHSSNMDNSNSSGFLMYSVQPQRFLQPGQTILNSACIYFDDQLSLCTNNAAIWIDAGSASSEPTNNRGYKIVPNPNYGHFEVQSSNVKPVEPGAKVEWWISDMNGKTIWDGSSTDLAGAPNEVMLERPVPGLYLLWMKNSGSLSVEQFAVIR